jgi:hypothetical protein
MLSLCVGDELLGAMFPASPSLIVGYNEGLAAHLQCYQFHCSILGSIHINFGGSGPALTAHGSPDFKQD